MHDPVHDLDMPLLVFGDFGEDLLDLGAFHPGIVTIWR